MTIWHAEYGAGEPVVLLHSTAADSGMWRSQVDALAGRFRVITVDFRGYGRSPYGADGAYSDAADVAEVLAGLGVGRAALVGSSGGTRVALELAAAGLADRLVLLNPVADVPPSEDVRAYWTEEERLVEAGDLDRAARLTARTLLGPHASDAAGERLAAMQRRAYELQVGGEAESAAEEVSPGAIDVPALVVSGAHDLEWFLLCARHLAAELPRGRLVELEWAGHLPAMERPEEIDRLLLDYL
ncbi:alpha/beta fold hydrolase [Nonomuraea sp. SYSU D8015]|uniref:alpha/beta fold hydrolase n=1 Tax=Nonomuraea sp. SYSU D8015 TaxID=2593644 RepID=UPI00166071D3|nr:alpha/beta hydrolase [Nonomuraea sp. SYSU D8015]